MTDSQQNAPVAPKGKLTPNMFPICESCGKITNRSYRWHSALNCWKCGAVMWRDDHSRTIDERRIADAAGDLEESPEDALRITRIPKTTKTRKQK